MPLFQVAPSPAADSIQSPWTGGLPNHFDLPEIDRIRGSVTTADAHRFLIALDLRVHRRETGLPGNRQVGHGFTPQPQHTASMQRLPPTLPRFRALRNELKHVPVFDSSVGHGRRETRDDIHRPSRERPGRFKRPCAGQGNSIRPHPSASTPTPG